MSEMTNTYEVFDRFLTKEGYWQDENGDWRTPEDRIIGSDGASAPNNASSNVIERCQKYVAKMNPSFSGQHGHDSAWLAAQAIFKGFSLSISEGWAVLTEFNQRCQPPWSDKELRHKAEDAIKNSKMPDGYIVGRPSQHQHNNTNQVRAVFKEDLEGVKPVLEKPTVENFPTHCLPGALEQFVCEIAESMACPTDFAASAALCISAGAIGTTRAIQLKKSWVECPRLFIAIVCDAGSSKSPAVRAICNPLYRKQERKQTEWAKAMESYDIDKKIWDYGEKLKSRRDVEAMRENGPKPKKPVYSHLFTSDSTTEGLAAILAEDDHGLVLINDEITGWVLSMNQYKGGKGADRQFWLSMWSGETAKVDRKNSEQGPLFIAHPFVNVVGSIPPSMLSELCDSKHREDGFVHRILFSFPDSVPSRHWTEASPSEEMEFAWAEVLDKLRELEPHTRNDGTKCPSFVRFSPDAKELWIEWYNQHVDEKNDPETSPELNGPWSKMFAHAGRITLAVHMLRWAYGETNDQFQIDAESMVKGAAITEYYKSHARRAYSQLRKKFEDEKIEKLYQKIIACGGTCTLKEIMRWHFCNRASVAIKMMEAMEDCGMGTIEHKNSTGGRRISTFKANCP